MEFTAELIALIAGAVISLIFSYFPVLRVKFAALTQEAKSGIMIGLNVAVVVAICLLDFFEAFDFGLTFDKSGIVQITMVFFAALIANQSTYMISPQPGDVKSAKDDRDYWNPG